MLKRQPWGTAPLTELIVCGGGSKNLLIMQMLEAELANVVVMPSDEMGWPSQWVEPAAFAWLARQHIHGVTGNLPAVTGASGTRILGALYPA